jgi:hypothetical protein
MSHLNASCTVDALRSRSSARNAVVINATAGDRGAHRCGFGGRPVAIRLPCATAEPLA